jgi:hypothetical protein
VSGLISGHRLSRKEIQFSRSDAEVRKTFSSLNKKVIPKQSVGLFFYLRCIPDTRSAALAISFARSAGSRTFALPHSDIIHLMIS